MPRIAATYVALLYEHLRARGFDPEAVFGEPGPQAADLGVARYAGDRWQEMLELGARTTCEPAFGVQVAKHLNARHLGLLGYLLMSCHSLGEALQRAERYHLLVSEMNPMKVRLEKDQFHLSWPLQHGWSGQLWDEVGIASVVQFARILTGSDTNPSRVDFVGPAPADLCPYVDFFGAEVRFGQPMPQLCCPLSFLKTSLRAPDPGLLELLDRQAEQLLQRLAPGPAALQRFREPLLQLMRERSPTLSALARRLGVSSRTVQRELSRHGASFQTMLAGMRRTLAMEYLADTRLALTDVADLLGYSDQSTFSRAFQQWTGETPGGWRRRRQ